MLEELLQAIREEGAVMRSALAAEIHAEEKSGPEDLVTNYDKLVQRHLEEKLHALLPQAGFLGEEGLRAPSGDGSVFIIDPIDGTMNFSRGYQRSSISVALARDGQVILGAVFDPYLDELFWAERGKGAFCNGRPIRVSDRPLERGLVMFGTAPYYREIGDKTFALARALFDRSLDVRRSGSAAIDLCSVAAGRAEVFYEMLLSPWDYAAASLILEEAGGIIRTLVGEPVSLTEKSSVLASNRAAWTAACQITQEVLH